MRFTRRPPEDIEINLTSLIDVVLLLVIFFTVTTQFVERSKIDLILPSASEQPVDK
ncbi:MAG: ExbD/TolR family protein, partial [Gammaproteobacteria bacterium]